MHLEIKLKLFFYSFRRAKSAKKRFKKIPMMTFKAVHLIDLIDLSVNGVGEPPLTLDLSDNELQNSFLTGQKIDLPDFPSHSQGVEQAVKLVMEPSQSVYGFEARHQHILVKVLCQQLRPAFSSELFDSIY